MRFFKRVVTVLVAVVAALSVAVFAACAEEEDVTVSYEFTGTYTDEGAVTVVNYDLKCFSDGTLTLECHEDRTGTWEKPNMNSIELVIDGAEYTAELVSGSYSFHYNDVIGQNNITVTLSTKAAGSGFEQTDEMLIQVFTPQVEELVKKYEGRTGEVILYGASNERNWTTVAEDTGYPVQNKSFGGSSLKIRHHFMQELIYDSQPQILISASSSNDWTRGETVEDVIAVREEVYAEMAQKLPDTVFIILSSTPNPLRYFGDYHEGMVEADEWSRQYCETHERFIYLDLVTAMTLADGSANMDIWQSDDLHLNEAGYDIFAKSLTDCMDAACEEYGISFEK